MKNEEFKPLSYEDALALVQAFPPERLGELDALVQKLRAIDRSEEGSRPVQSGSSEISD